MTKCQILCRKLHRAKDMKRRCDRAKTLTMVSIPIFIMGSIVVPFLWLLVLLAIIGLAVNANKAAVYESECDDIRLQIADCHTGHHK